MTVPGRRTWALVAVKQGGLMDTAAWSFEEEEKYWGYVKILCFRAGKHVETAFAVSVLGHMVAIDIPWHSSPPQCLFMHQTRLFCLLS